ncbi:MAG: thiol-disulfide oxidoreductase DCC family protein, partial [Planctomycetes bacterium]|nr:thiol-disulfide oxidoreductase DCC family protein [Planctomycetota bacterium]
METQERSGHRLIVFDGVCNLCNAAVRWVIEHDRHGAFRFASLQSEAGREALAAASAPLDLPDSVVLIDEAGVHARSDAAIRITRHLGLPWSLLSGARLVPRPIRDAVYSGIAGNRYRWFGRRETCMVPTSEFLDRFLDTDKPKTLEPVSSSGPPDAMFQSSAAVASATQQQVRQSRVQLANQFLLRIVFVYLFIYIFCFPVGWIPGTEWLDEQYVNLKQVVIPALARVVFAYDITIFPAGSGDTTYNYVEVFTFAMIALLGALGWSFIKRGKPVSQRTHDLMRTYVRYCLGAFMLSYGWAKLLPVQFGVPGPDRMMTPIGDTSPMGLLWTFMGASPAYTMFAGFGEALSGFLLLWRRTALPGALLAAGVMLNVVALNFCYDVPVKLFSIHLMLMAVFVIVPDAVRLLSVLLFNLPAQPRVLRPFPINRKWLRHTRVLAKVAFVYLVGVVPALTSYESLKTTGWLMPRTP